MKDRIKQIRKDAGLTQTAFGERLGLTMNMVYLMESGRKNPSNATIREICRQFSVREDWLRTGEGDVYRDLTPAMEAADKVRRLLIDSPASAAGIVISSLLELDPAGPEWDAIAAIFEIITNKRNGGLS